MGLVASVGSSDRALVSDAFTVGLHPVPGEARMSGLVPRLLLAAGAVALLLGETEVFLWTTGVGALLVLVTPRDGAQAVARRRTGS